MCSSSNSQTVFKLSNGFFQQLAENRADGLKPIVQNSRFTNDRSGIRLRLNDGVFSYATIILRDKGFEKFISIGMEGSQSIIKLLDFSLNTALRDGHKRAHLTINDFELLSKESPLIGTPVPHSGDVDEQSGSTHNDTNQTSLEMCVSQTSRSDENVNNVSIVPIISISPFLIHWRICGVITEKSSIVEIKTPNGPNKVLDFYITDKEGMEIKFFCYGSMVNEINDLVQVFSSYFIKGSNKSVRVANKRFNHSRHEYEIIIKTDTEITKCDIPVQIPLKKINRVTLSRIKIFSGGFVDVIVIVDSMENAVDVGTKNGVTKKKVASLVDESGCSTTLVAWGSHCNELTNDLLHKPIIIKNVLVNEFKNNYNLVYCNGSKIIKSDGTEVFQQLLNWFKKERGKIVVNNNLPLKVDFEKHLTIHAAAANDLVEMKANRNNRYFTLIARVSRFKENLIYKACLQSDCRKKVINNDGQYYCTKCDSTSKDFKYAFFVTFEVFDHSGMHWLTLFGNNAEVLLKKSPSEVGKIIDAYGDFEGQNKVVSSIINNIYSFSVMSSINMYNEIPQIKWIGRDVKPVKLAEYAKHLERMYNDAEEICSQHKI